MAKPLTLTAKLAAADSKFAALDLTYGGALEDIAMLKARIVELERQLAEVSTTPAPAPAPIRNDIPNRSDLDYYAAMCGIDTGVPVKAIRKTPSTARVTRFTKRDGSIWEKRCTGFNQYTSVCVTPAAEVAHA